MKRTSLPLQRREFITLLGGAAAAWPLAARAQQPAMRRSAMLSHFWPTRTTARICARSAAACRDGLIEARNIAIEYRWADGDLISCALCGRTRRVAAGRDRPATSRRRAGAASATARYRSSSRSPTRSQRFVASLTRPAATSPALRRFRIRSDRANGSSCSKQIVPTLTRVAVFNPAIIAAIVPFARSRRRRRLASS